MPIGRWAGAGLQLNHVVGNALAHVLVSHKQNLLEPDRSQEAEHVVCAVLVHRGGRLIKDEEGRRGQEGPHQGHADSEAERIERGGHGLASAERAARARARRIAAPIGLLVATEIARQPIQGSLWCVCSAETRSPLSVLAPMPSTSFCRRASRT